MASTPIPPAVTRRRQTLAKDGSNLTDTVVPLVVQQGDTPPPPPSDTPPTVVIDPVGLENDDFVRKFMGDALTPDTPAAPAVEPSAPAIPAPVSVSEPNPVAAPPVPAPPATFDSLFALDSGVQPPAPAPAAPAVDPTAQAIEALREQIAQLTQTPPAPASAAPIAAPTGGYSLSSEQLDVYREAIPVVENVASTIVQAALAPLVARIDEMRAELNGRTSDFDSRLSDIRGRTYKAQLYAAIPDIDALVVKPEFQAFIAQTIPYSGETVRSRLGAAHQSQDVMAVSAIMNDFRRFAGGSGAGPTIASMAAPVPSAAPAVPSQPGQDLGAPKKLPWSRMKEATRLRNAGRMTAEEFNKVKALFNTAEAEDRIDYNA